MRNLQKKIDKAHERLGTILGREKGISTYSTKELEEIVQLLYPDDTIEIKYELERRSNKANLEAIVKSTRWQMWIAIGTIMLAIVTFGLILVTVLPEINEPALEIMLSSMEFSPKGELEVLTIFNKGGAPCVLLQFKTSKEYAPSLLYLIDYEFFSNLPEYDFNKGVFVTYPIKLFAITTRCNDSECVTKLNGNLEPNQSVNFGIYNYKKGERITVNCSNKEKASIILK